MYCYEFQESSVAKLGSVCRRVYRIFSHAYFHHRQIFEAFESDTHLCRRFTVFVTKYKLMTRDNLIVPILEGEEENVTVVAPNTTTGVVPQGESEAWIKNLLLPRFVIVFPLQVVQKIHVFKNTSNANQVIKTIWFLFMRKTSFYWSSGQVFWQLCSCHSSSCSSSRQPWTNQCWACYWQIYFSALLA